jgi:hypothetical protein
LKRREVAVFDERLHPARRILGYHQCFIVNGRITIRLLRLEYCVDDPQQLVPDCDNTALVPPADHQRTILAFELAVLVLAAALLASHSTCRSTRLPLRRLEQKAMAFTQRFVQRLRQLPTFGFQPPAGMAHHRLQRLPRDQPRNHRLCRDTVNITDHAPEPNTRIVQDFG